MPLPRKIVASITELAAACKEAGVRHIAVRGNIVDAPSIRLSPGQALTGDGEDSSIAFAPGADGVQLSMNNEVSNLRLEAAVNKRAIWNDTTADTLGHIRISGVATVGQVQILAREKVRSGHVEVDGLDVIAADARERSDRPSGFGVKVIQGAFTLWNMQEDEGVAVSAQLRGVSAGRPAAPVRGSGIFVSGAGFKGGRLVVPLLETGAVYSDGGIEPGTPDVITGGVFTVYGAVVDVVRNLGPVVTYGVNDMVLDNWGSVDQWVAEAKLTSYGPSGIGFVNFGSLNQLTINAPIETFGKGARGFNVYDGTLNQAIFDRITTHADGAVGVQISKPIGRLVVRRGIETFGGTGESLVKGMVVTLSAIGLSIKPGGSARAVEIEGGVTTNGKGIVPIELHGTVATLCISGGVSAAGRGFEKI
jgi:hypothetical protein